MEKENIVDKSWNAQRWLEKKLSAFRVSMRKILLAPRKKQKMSERDKTVLNYIMLFGVVMMVYGILAGNLAMIPGGFIIFGLSLWWTILEDEDERKEGEKHG